MPNMLFAASSTTPGLLSPLLVGIVVLGGLGVALASISARRWRRRFNRLNSSVLSLARGGAEIEPSWDDPAFSDTLALLRILVGQRSAALDLDSSNFELSADSIRPRSTAPGLTRGGLFESPSLFESSHDLSASSDFKTTDMVIRLHPETLFWLEASPAAQEFLGWPLAQLRAMSFLEVVVPEHRELAREQLQTSVVRGEAHGLIYRIATECGEVKAVEMNVSVRYAPDMRVTHLRCHLTDVTAKLQASRELRRRTRELAQANTQLRSMNRELQELKDRYSDLYQNAPTMYFSLDEHGRIQECNNTLLRTLGYRRKELIGRDYTCLLTPERAAEFPANQAEFLRNGHIEVESRWVKANGDRMVVWVTASAVKDQEGRVILSRSVAQDVTARHTLEAELHEKNEGLSRKNKELDDFSYVISHDLQEPVRTLISFAEFLMAGYGERLNPEGREYLQHLVDASRRLRVLINDLLDLSRAGRAAGDFTEVDVESVVGLLKSDFAELIRSRGAEIQIAGPLPRVWGDRDRIGQLFGNLLCNGLKYNRQEAPILEIGAVATGDSSWTSFYVRDNGIGIDPQFHAKIFKMFRRLHTRDEYEGTGAGLAICHKIVQAHGGRIWVESEIGRGATFFLILPRKPAPLPTPRTEVLNVP